MYIVFSFLLEVDNTGIISLLIKTSGTLKTWTIWTDNRYLININKNIWMSLLCNSLIENSVNLCTLRI